MFTGRTRSVTLQGELPGLREYRQRGISDTDRFGQALLSGQTLLLNPRALPDRVSELGLYGAAVETRCEERASMSGPMPGRPERRREN